MSQISIKNARVFDGHQILPPTTVTTQGDIISSIGQDPPDNADETIIDAKD
jgi:dihydroorotase-like cyclic amidohydrolase